MPSPVPVTLATLMTPATPEEVLQDELTACIALGLPTTSWEPVSMIPTVLNVNAEIAAAQTQDAANLAAGAYASTAAEMTAPDGSPITTWMQLRATDQYGITPQPASYASGPVPYTNTSGTGYSYAPNNPLRAQNLATRATYVSVGTGTLAASSSGTVQFQADVAGAGSTSAAGVTLVLMTPLNGVTLGVLTSSLVGSNAETNQQLLSRGQNKLATLAPIQSTDIPGPVSGGAAGAYRYVATSIPQAGTASSAPPFAVTSTITDCLPITNPATGAVTVVCRNATGAPSSTDLSVVFSALLLYVVPDGVQISTVGVSTLSIAVVGTIYIAKSFPVNPATAVTNALDALAQYMAGVPIGGYTTSTANIIPISDLYSAIIGANKGTIDVQLSSPASNVYLGATGVPVLDPSSTFAVVFV